MELWNGALVSPDWLARNLDDPSLRIFDVTVQMRPDGRGGLNIESGRADYEAAHIPRAGFLDLIRELSDTESPLRFTMPDVAAFAETLAAAGVGQDARIVIYSASSPMWATRLWWMLHASGFDQAAVLDGGLERWRAEGRPIEQGAFAYPAARLTLSPRPGAWAAKSDVVAAMADAGACTIDALPARTFRGEGAGYGGRKGHISGARNVPFESLLTREGRFRSDDELRAELEAVGALESARAICYCGGGIAATMTALALKRLGHPSVAVYDGSLSEWTSDPALPMETGA